MTDTLVVLAAGLGSRFGGTKQLESVGPDGEAFLDFAIRDARATGIERVVVVVRTDIEDMVRDHLARHHAADAAIALECQDRLGPPRAKPWGTVHAVLAAAPSIEGRFAVVNADDHYGPESYRLAAAALRDVSADQAALVAFRLGNTVPERGSVSRGVCVVDGGRLVAIDEHRTIERDDAGQLRSEHGPLADTTPVSMNLWCFDRPMLDLLQARFDAFLDEHRDEAKAECLLPVEVGALMAKGLTVRVIDSPERWIGVTNPEDLELARELLSGRTA
ncbi:MAG: NTP transferase domain-containing protein [Actinomycetota bacterium]